MKHIEVVAAIIIKNGKILCTQRNFNKYDYISKKFEFPGGKVEKGESNEEAIIREIKEELSINITVNKEFLSVYHEYPDFHLTMHSFLCSAEDKTLSLNEHIDYKWLLKDELSSLDWAGADLPIVDKLISEFHE
ncbi:(deoxy)nucleoside triphosphate pyrophosphohydrolase [Marinilabiliaceae bacterium JC040]|nr:(deoxy)nucleoside triphosphate pyrophosphohydrolase [Marinilabiliaceae bacterium JC040]